MGKSAWMVAGIKAQLARDLEHRGLILVPTAERAATVRAMFTEAELARLTIVATDDLAPF